MFDMQDIMPGVFFNDILGRKTADAVAWIRGNEENPNLNGFVRFFMTPYKGILIEAELFGLPNYNEAGATNFYAMHIHENGDCTLPFDKTGNHYATKGQLHPNHLGDLTPVMENQGYAWNAFYNERIKIPEILGRSVIVHAMPDDFMTQPSGASGEKIGCGVIQ